MRTFKFAAREIIATPTGDGFKETTLVLTLDDQGRFVSLLPEKQQGYLEGAPNPER